MIHFNPEKYLTPLPGVEDFHMRRIVFTLWLFLISCSLSSNIYSEESYTPGGAKEIFIEFYTIDFVHQEMVNYIGGHYTYYFNKWLAAGPGFTIPPLDWSMFNLGVFIHSYFFPFPEWFVKPFVYLQAGLHFTDLEYTFRDFGIDKPGTLWYWAGFIRPGAGVEIKLLNTGSGVISARAMLYQHIELLHMQYLIQLRSNINLSVGLTWAFY